MFYCVEDKDGDIAYHTTDPNDPDIQRFMDKYEYFDPQVKEYDEIWEVWADYDDKECSFIVSIHSEPTDAIMALRNDYVIRKA